MRKETIESTTRDRSWSTDYHTEQRKLRRRGEQNPKIINDLNVNVLLRCACVYTNLNNNNAVGDAAVVAGETRDANSENDAQIGIFLRRKYHV